MKISILTTFLFITLNTMAKLQAQPTFTYTVSMNEPHTHYFDVALEIQNWESDSLTLKMATWTPGSYLIREFSRKVESMAAKSGESVLPIQKTSKNTWAVATSNMRALTVTYRVYSFEYSVRTSYLDADQAMINGASLFLYADGKQHLPITIKITPYKGWNTISTALKSTSKNKWTLEAPNYDTLVDAPIQIGTHKVIDFEAAGVPHHLALVGKGNYDETQMVEDIKKIVEAQRDIFGEHPCENYTIINHNTNTEYGGLEHHNSCAIVYPRWDYAPATKYQRWLGLMSHEYFHLWNVKRLRPIALGPFDYEHENYTNSLWIAEGITSYYDDYVLRRANLINADTYLSIAAQNINTHENTPGKTVQPVAEASFDAWVKYYRPDENTQNCCVSYYLEGGILGMLLDLEILHNTQGTKNLDDAMRTAYNTYYKQLKRGFTEDEFKTVVEQVAGTKMDDFWKNYVNGTTPINYEKYLNYAGLTLTPASTTPAKASFGASLTDDNNKVIVKNVKRGGCGYADGLNANDEIIAIDNYRTTSTSQLNTILDNKKAGDALTVLVNRSGIIRTLTITLSLDNAVNHKITRLANPTPQQEEIFRKWLWL